MYKLLLVDDEDEIRGRIQTLLKDIPGFEVVESVGNGFDALDYCEQNPVDVVLSDIKMPFIDGIEMTRQIRTLYPNIKVAFITGYDDFEYAKEAINLKIEHYLMKPIAHEELRDFLNRLKNEMDEALEKKKQFSSLRQNYDAMQPHLIEKTLMSYIVYKEITEKDLYRLKAMGLMVPEDADYYGIWLTVPSERRMDDLYYALKTFIQTELASESFQEIMVFPEGLLVLRGDASPTPPTIETMIRHWSIMIERFFEVSVTAFISRIYAGIQALPTIFKDLTHLRESIPQLQTSLTYFYDDHVTTHKILVFEAEDLDILKRLFLSNPEGLKKFIQAQFKNADRIVQGATPQLKTELYLATLHVAGLLDPEVIQTGELSPSMFEDASDYESLHQHFEALLTTWQTRMMREHNSATSRIQEIIQFVEDSIRSRELSLDYISQKFFISVPYISKQFKEKTGVTFSRYVTQKRVALAQELLTQTSLSISQIALDVGYKDVYYFSHVFKRVVGTSPREYRP